MTVLFEIAVTGNWSCFFYSYRKCEEYFKLFPTKGKEKGWMFQRFFVWCFRQGGTGTAYVDGVVQILYSFGRAV